MPNSPADEQRINAIRFLAVDAVQKANSGHPGLPLGAAAMAYALWTRHLQFNPADPHWFDRDRFVLSAGHGSMLLYALLYLTGYDVSLEDLKSFRQLRSKTPGHPEVGHTPGVEATTGPLGQGLGNAVGMAIAEAHLGAVYNRAASVICDHYTYVLCGDGDLMEGISQEAISLAGHLKLGKLIVLYDDNRVSLAGPTDITFTDDACARFDACGWHTQFLDVSHANDVDAIDQAIRIAKNVPDRPSMIAVRTHIGYGSPFQDSFKSHGEPLGPENVKKTKEALGWPADRDFYVPEDVLKFYRECGANGGREQAAWNDRYDSWKNANAELAAQLERAVDGRLPAALPWPVFTPENGNVATRDAGGTVMNAIAGALPELVGGSADLDPSTKTYLKDQGDFEPGSYAGRNIHYGVREHAMAAATNGIALHGGAHAVLPRRSSISSTISSRRCAWRAERTACHLRLHARLGVPRRRRPDASTDRATRDAARDAPINVVRPADALETLEAWKLAIEPRSGARGSLVLTRQKVPFLGARNADVDAGRLRHRSTPTARPTLMLSPPAPKCALAIDAKRLLDAKGVRTRVVSMPCWELFERPAPSLQGRGTPAVVSPRACRSKPPRRSAGRRYVGDRGIAFGIDHFGRSAPAAAIAKDSALRQRTSPRLRSTRSPSQPDNVYARRTREKPTASNCSTPARAYGSTICAAACLPPANCSDSSIKGCAE